MIKKYLLCALAALSILPLGAKTSERQVAIVAHRGYWASEAGGKSHNSIAALKAAQDLDFWGSEFDVNMTKDGVLLVFHDDAVRNLRISTMRSSLLSLFLMGKRFLLSTNISVSSSRTRAAVWFSSSSGTIISLVRSKLWSRV